MRVVFLWIILMVTAVVSIYYDNELYLNLWLGFLSLIIMLGVSFFILKMTKYKKTVALIVSIVLFVGQWWLTENMVMVAWVIYAKTTGQSFAP